MPQKEFRNTVIYYFKVWLAHFKASLKKGRVNKGEIFIRILRTLFILFTQVLLLQLVFGNQEIYIGWTKSQAYLVMGIWNVLNYTGWALFGVNLSHLEERVLNGDFDYILLKPLSSAWLSSFSEFSLYNWISSLAGWILILFYFITIPQIYIRDILLGFVEMVVGLIIWYSIYLFLASFSISRPRNGFLAIAKEILGLAKYPINIYGNFLQLFFYILIPIAFVSTAPANFLIGRADIWLLVASLAISFIVLVIALRTWKRNLQKYVSCGG